MFFLDFIAIKNFRDIRGSTEHRDIEKQKHLLLDYAHGRQLMMINEALKI